MHRKILIADDNVTMRKQLQQLLHEQGYDVTAVGNGDLALAKMQESKPHMVMLDVIMPGKTGYELCDYIKNEPDLNQIPVILTFSENEPFDLSEARRVGATRCLPKTIEPEQLISILDFIWAGVTPIEYAHSNSSAKANSMSNNNLNEPIELPPAGDDDSPQEVELELEPVVEGEPEDEQPSYAFEVKLEAETDTSDSVEPAEMEIDHEKQQVQIPGLEPAVKKAEAAAASGGSGSLYFSDNPISEDSFRLEATNDEDNPDDPLHIKDQLSAVPCRECGSTVMTGDVFCVECGAAIDEAVVRTPGESCCAQCGQAINSGDVFCLNCGAVQ